MMGFGLAIKTCLSKFVTFSGRAPRAEYWWFALFTTLIFILAEVTNPTLGLVADVVFLLPSLAVGWRRMHDIGRSGLWQLALFLLGTPLLLDDLTGGQIFLYVEENISGVINMDHLLYAGAAILLPYFIYVFVLTIQRGDVGANKYGDDPYVRGSDPSVFD